MCCQCGASVFGVLSSEMTPVNQALTLIQCWVRERTAFFRDLDQYFRDGPDFCAELEAD